MTRIVTQKSPRFTPVNNRLYNFALYVMGVPEELVQLDTYAIILV